MDLYLQYDDLATGNYGWKLDATIVADASGNYTFDGVSSYAIYEVQARAEGYEEREEDYIGVLMERADKTGQDIKLQRILPMTPWPSVSRMSFSCDERNYDR